MNQTQHFLYVMQAASKAPASGGDTKSWFHFYKWDIGGEVFVPQQRPFLEAKEGDFLWFVMDGEVLGGSKIIRIEREESQGVQELWYRGDDLYKLEPPSRLSEDACAVRQVTDKVGEEWLARAVRSGF